MGNHTSIEWTEATWNPVRGCSIVSAGCANCYAMKTAHRFNKPGEAYAGLTEMGPQGARWTGKVKLMYDLLDAPLHWKKPRKIFVNSMSDLFHEDVPFDFIHWIFSTIRQTPQHTYQILTKRPARMLEVMSLIASKEALGWAKGFYSHVWIGVSVENQATADERIPILLQTPAAVRWISAEPLLGPVDILPYTYYGSKVGANRGLQWVVVGGESGPGARYCDLAWIRSLVEQCRATNVSVFVKQLGSEPRFDRDESVKFQQSRKGGNIDDFPEDLRVREWPR